MHAAFDPTVFDPHASAFLADPYPTYASFRAHAPVCKVAPYGSFWVFRYADVRTVLEEKTLYLKNPKAPAVSPTPFGVLQYMPQGLFSLDPPRHDELRAMLDPLFASAISDAAALAAAKARSLLAAARSSRRIEFVSAYAQPLPSEILMTVLGIPATHHGGIGQWVSGVLAGHDITAPLQAQMLGGTCAFALGAYFQALIRGCPIAGDERRLLDLMVTQAQPRGMTAEEVQQSAVNFAVAGYLSTVFLIATGTLNLVRNPAQLERLRRDPALMESAIDEMLRYDAPAQLVDRFVAEDTELGGVRLAAGDQVTAVLGSANRDSEAFASPDDFDIGRDARAHLGFGAGIHYCIGAPLVRLVAPVAFRTLLEEIPELALEGLPQWQTDPYLRSVVNLPLAIG